MFDFSIVTNWIHELLLSIMPEGISHLYRMCSCRRVPRSTVCHPRYHIDLHGA